MQYGHYHINNTDVKELIAENTGRGSIKSISICNASSGNDATVKLYLHDGTDANDTSILEAMVIPGGTTLILDHDLQFNNGDMALRFQVTSGSSIDINIIIK